MFLTFAKDKLVQFTALSYFGIRYHQLGKMTTLQLDTEKRQIRAILDLHGEQTPIDLTIHYILLGSNKIELTDVQSSREWVATLVNQILTPEQRCIPVSTIVYTALSTSFFRANVAS